MTLQVLDRDTAYIRFPAEPDHPRPPRIGDAFTFGFGGVEVRYAAVRVLLQGVKWPEYVVFLKRIEEQT